MAELGHPSKPPKDKPVSLASYKQAKRALKTQPSGNGPIAQAMGYPGGGRGRRQGKTLATAHSQHSPWGRNLFKSAGTRAQEYRMVPDRAELQPRTLRSGSRDPSC